MDAVWYGIQSFSEGVFELAKPMGRLVNIFFISVGFIGTAFWLWYGEKTRKGGHNFMADPADKK